MYGGEECPTLEESRDCNPNACPIDCVVGDWTDWEECSVTCGGGEQERSREIVVYDDHGGALCSDYDLFETQDCNDNQCPVNCEVSQWTEYSECTVSCGGGEKTRTREVTQPAMYGGEACPEDLTDTVECGTAPCPIDCEVGDWDDWGECTASCGGGTQERTRSITQQDQYGGLPCSTFALTDVQSCGDDPCPIPCEVSDWSDWDVCSVTCGEGQQRRIRDILQDAEHGGETCDDYALIDYMHVILVHVLLIAWLMNGENGPRVLQLVVEGRSIDIGKSQDLMPMVENHVQVCKRILIVIPSLVQLTAFWILGPHGVRVQSLVDVVIGQDIDLSQCMMIMEESHAQITGTRGGPAMYSHVQLIVS